MSTNPLISQLIEEKKVARYLKFLHMGIFFLTALYVFLYEMVLVEIPAINHELYAIGKIMDGVAEAVVTGYIFYFFTEIIPEKSRKRSAKPIIEYQKAQLASQLDCLMQVLLKDNNWEIKNNLELKANYDKIAKERRIWTEKCSGLLEDDVGIVHYQPTTLFCIDLLMQRISDSIDKLISLSRYVDQNYIEKICWVSESKLFLRLHICDGAYKLVDSVTESGNTYMDSFFNEELAIRLFSRDKANNIFIEKIRELIKQTAGDNEHGK